jgi:hypothetical protein
MEMTAVVPLNSVSMDESRERRKEGRKEGRIIRRRTGRGN